MPSTLKPGLSCADNDAPADQLPIQWRRFIRLCEELRYGEIEKLSIQDGVPVLAQTVTKKIKFA